jgi:hypothetical protein
MRFFGLNGTATHSSRKHASILLLLRCEIKLLNCVFLCVYVLGRLRLSRSFSASSLPASRILRHVPPLPMRKRSPSITTFLSVASLRFACGVLGLAFFYNSVLDIQIAVRAVPTREGLLKQLQRDSTEATTLADAQSFQTALSAHLANINSFYARNNLDS